MAFSYFAHTELKSVPTNNPFGPDNKTLLFPLIDTSKNWTAMEGKMFWRYPYYDSDDNSYQSYDAQYYTLELSPQTAYPNVTSVWNIKTDKELIDLAKNSANANGTHNGFVSTNLANFLVRMTYLQKEWVPPVVLSLPQLNAGVLDVLVEKKPIPLTPAQH